MRKIYLFVICAALCLSCSATAEEKKKDVQWQVNIEIQYNAIDREDAEEIIARAMKQHGGACTVEAKTKKVGESVYIINGSDTVSYFHTETKTVD